VQKAGTSLCRGWFHEGDLKTELAQASFSAPSFVIIHITRFFVNLTFCLKAPATLCLRDPPGETRVQ
jgi:hypothetical protein